MGQALLDLKSGSAGGQEVPGFRPSSEGMWAPCSHMRRHAHVGTHAGMLETCVHSCGHMHRHAQAHVCTLVGTQVKIHSNGTMQIHTQSCSGARGCLCGHTLTDMLQHTHVGGLRYVHVSTVLRTGVPVWDGMHTCARDT